MVAGKAFDACALDFSSTNASKLNFTAALTFMLMALFLQAICAALIDHLPSKMCLKTVARKLWSLALTKTPRACALRLFLALDSFVALIFACTSADIRCCLTAANNKNQAA